MKIIYIKYGLIINLLIVTKLNAQNLISNPSFEDYTSCPDAGGEINNCLNWYSATDASPDLFNLCNDDLNQVLSVPSNALGYEFANDGVGYVGVYTYANQSGTIDLREYIQQNIGAPLSLCNIYELNFYVSLSDSSHYATNSFGAFVGDSAIYRNDYLCFSYYEPQVSNPKTRMLSEKNGWTKIVGKFVAVGGEQYITIGNFNPDNEIDTFGTNNNYGIIRSYAYYYIDDLSLTLFSDASMPANAGPDIDLTEGDSVFIGQEISNLNCMWSILGGAEIADSISGIYVQPTENTTYVVEQNLCGVTTYDTVTVFVHGVGLDESSPSIPLQRGKVVPNPNNGSFDIDLSELNSEIQDLSILDASGRIVYQEKNVASKNTAEGKLKIQTQLEKGVYFLRVSSEKSVFEEKIVIQ